MSGKRYVCRVVREFGQVEDGRFVMRNPGDEVVRDEEPADDLHLEVLRVEDEPGKVLIVNPAPDEAAAAVERDAGKAKSKTKA